jgi:ATP-dependent Lon protease
MMKKAGTKNPILMLDEVDKMSMDFRGDPSAALLEVLDPEQNYMFMDHYLDVEYDLSQVFFIATANVLHTIPPALQDRMEVIRLSGYTELEKLEIAKRFLVPKQMKDTGVSGEQVEFTDPGLQVLIQSYTREAGVRNLEREIGNLCRKVARKVVEAQTAESNEPLPDGAEGLQLEEEEPQAAEPAKKGKKKAKKEEPPLVPIDKVVVAPEKVAELLGPARFRDLSTEKQNEVGVTTGLAWTEVGGSILTTEATVMEGRGKMMTTGKLGDVMQESAQAAMSYVRSRAQYLGLPKDFYRHLDIHVHVPEGAIPKDGPSAGITIATSICSSLTGIPVRCDLAMTGEITVRGRVLAIGGLKEKLLAAHRQGIFEVVLPKDNEKDLADIPENIRSEMNLHFVLSMDEVLKIALEREIVALPLAPAATAAELAGRPEDNLTH